MDPLTTGKPHLIFKHFLHEARVTGVHIVQQADLKSEERKKAKMFEKGLLLSVDPNTPFLC